MPRVSLAGCFHLAGTLISSVRVVRASASPGSKVPVVVAAPAPETPETAIPQIRNAAAQTRTPLDVRKQLLLNFGVLLLHLIFKLRIARNHFEKAGCLHIVTA